MKVAFYAPLKAVDHPVPSGDRQMGRALLDALRAGGHDAFVASRFRTFDRHGDPARQLRLKELGQRLAARLVARFERVGVRPAVWFTYHLHHKAPDWLGPVVSAALDIPYVIAEASISEKQADGPWSVGYAGSVAAVRTAAATVFLNPADLRGIGTLRGPARADERMLPFLDVDAFSRPPSASAGDAQQVRGRRRLVTVAMMRPGAKLASYRLLAAALAQVPSPAWELVVVGDGQARAEVEAAFASFDAGRIRLVGFQSTPRLVEWLRASDLFLWPAIDEAFGMALLEAQACGVPVVAGDGIGVGAVVADGRTGLLVPPGDAKAFADAVRLLLSDDGRRRRMASEAALYARTRHGLPAAASRLDALLRRVTAEHVPRAATRSPVAAAR
jgi:glycosyltransferase involved in cell wall biosynthesis